MGGFQFVTWIHSWDTEFLSRKEQDDAQCVLQKTKLVDRGGSSGVCREHWEFVLCPLWLVGGSLCAQTTVGWCAQSWWRIHNVAAVALYNTRSSQFIAFLLIHTGQKGKLLPRVRNTILLVSALLWLSYGESTVSLRSHTGRHKHSLEGSTTSGFFPGPGWGSPSHLGAKSFGPRGITGAPLPFVTDGGWWWRPRGTSGDVRPSREVDRSRSAAAPAPDDHLTLSTILMLVYTI